MLSLSNTRASFVYVCSLSDEENKTLEVFALLKQVLTHAKSVISVSLLRSARPDVEKNQTLDSIIANLLKNLRRTRYQISKRTISVVMGTLKSSALVFYVNGKKVNIKSHPTPAKPYLRVLTQRIIRTEEKHRVRSITQTRVNWSLIRFHKLLRS
jgi:hypothetical protein